MCWPFGLLSTGGLNSRNSSIEIEAPAAAPTTEDSEAQPVARAMLPFHACITKSHRAASHRGVAIGHIKVDRSDTLKQKSCKMHAHLYLQWTVSCDRTCNETSAVTYKKIPGMKDPTTSAVTSNIDEQNMKGPPAVTEALSTSGKNLKGPPAGNKTMKGPPAGRKRYRPATL